MEKFVAHARDIFRGTTDIAMPEKAGRFGDRSKFDVIAVELENVNLMASIYAVVDLASWHTSEFHQWTKQK